MYVHAASTKSGDPQDHIFFIAKNSLTEAKSLGSNTKHKVKVSFFNMVNFFICSPLFYYFFILAIALALRLFCLLIL